MTQPAAHASRLPRRRALQWIAGLATLASAPMGRLALAQTNVESTLSPSAQAWRAMSRLGYGPSPTQIGSLSAAPNAQTWALQQVDSALWASQQPPKIPAQMVEINQSLPGIFEGTRKEREARAKAKADPATMTDDRDEVNFNRTMVRQAAAWRLSSCSDETLENPLLARMTEFWFNHLNVYSGKGSVRPFVGHYLVNVARAHALGKFEDLLLASARHPAMLHYLDQVQSVADGTMGPKGSKRGLNENYARELMELHTLGVNGGYTQTDVRELARVLTGWTIDPNSASGFRFATRQHDQGHKTVMGHLYPSGLIRSGETEGEEAIRMLARHPKTAARISLRLAQFFVSDQSPPALVEALTRRFLESQGDMRLVMRELLASPEFWRAENRLFKTPMDFACSALAATQGSADPRKLLMSAKFLTDAGQPVHGWQTPDGYPVDAATWLAPEALTRRADFAMTLARDAGDMGFLDAFMSPATLTSIGRERPGLRDGLLLASPDFMYK
jgi:uncharacterized protein (DUF1800 family)